MVSAVRADGGRGTLGAVVLSRPAEALDHRLDVLWAWLAAVLIGGLLAAAAISTALARWVSRPLAELETAAQHLGDGALDTRAAGHEGPQEVRRLAANFNLMAARLQALMHGHQAMMADVSHQLRTPLAALRLRLDVLAQDGDAAMAEELAGAQEEIARLGRMVNGLLAVARAENVTTQPVQVAVDAVLRDRVAAWRPAAEEREVTLAAGLEPAAARLGEGQLEQIIDNLLANALDAVPAGGTVRVSAQAAAGRTTITVADDGPGMSAPAAAHRLPPVRLRHPRRHRARAGDRRPAGHLGGRHRGAVRHSRRRPDRHDRAAGRAAGGGGQHPAARH